MPDRRGMLCRAGSARGLIGESLINRSRTEWRRAAWSTRWERSASYGWCWDVVIGSLRGVKAIGRDA